MDKQEVYQLLKLILSRIEAKSFVWRLDGTVNLLVQAIEVIPGDLDISTNEKGMEVFANALSEYVKSKGYNENIGNYQLICEVNGLEVEINTYGDRKFDKFKHIEYKNWRGLNLPILPLKQAKEFYKLIGREKKEKLISEHLLKITE